MREHRYHPWRALRGLPHITLRWSAAVARGRVDGHTITLHPLLTQAERRSTLAHELVHLERGPAPPHLTAREELLVEEIAARRLVDLDDLADAIVWHDGLHRGPWGSAAVPQRSTLVGHRRGESRRARRADPARTAAHVRIVGDPVGGEREGGAADARPRVRGAHPGPVRASVRRRPGHGRGCSRRTAAEGMWAKCGHGDRLRTSRRAENLP